MSSAGVVSIGKGEALEWMRGAVRGCGMGSSGVVTAFGLAWEELERQKAHPERWKGWVLDCVDRARAKASRDVGGLLITLLRDGCADDLRRMEAKPSSAAEVRARETEEYLERLRAERATLPANRLSLVALMHAHRMGLNVRELVTAWEAEGCPRQEDLEFPGWEAARAAAERKPRRA